MAVNALQYIKNVGKSFGYAAIDAFGEYNPQIKSLASGAKEFSSDLYQTIDDFKATMTDTDSEKGLIGQGKDIVKDLRNNLMEDLKSGNWYNKQRAQQAEESMMEAMFGSFDDFDFDFDDIDFDDDGSESSSSDSISSDTAAVVSSNQKSAKAIVDSMDMVGRKTAGAISTATVKSADYIVSANKQVNKALYSLHAKGYQQMSTGLAAINQNMAALVTLAEPLTTHMQNSATFFTSSAEYQKNVLEKLDILIKNTTVPEQQVEMSNKKTLSSILTADGVIDLSSYFGMITDNIKAYKDEAMGLLDMMGGPQEIAKMITSNPIGLISKFMIDGAIPQMMKSSMQAFNDSLGNVFAAGFDKMKNTTFKGPIGSIFEQFKDIFMPKSDFKDKIDVAQYNKGKAQWTGKSEKALQEVIPMYLSTIASALTGGPVTKFNYETGKYITMRGVENLEKTRMQRAAQNAGGEFRYDALNVADMVGFDDQEKKEIKEKIENYFLNAFKKGDSKATHINDADFDYQSFGLDEKSLDVLRQVLKSYQKRDSRGNNNVWKALEFASNVSIGRDDFGAQTRRMEQQGGVETAVYDSSDVIYKGNEKNKLRAGGLLGVDKYNHDIFWYLQKLYQHTRHVSENIGFIGGGVIGGGPLGGSPIEPIKDIEDDSESKVNQDAASNRNQQTQQNDSNANNTNFNDRLKEALDNINDPDNARKREKFKTKKGEEFKQKREDVKAKAATEEWSQAQLDEELKKIQEEEDKSFDSFIRGTSDDSNKIGAAKKIFKNIQSIFTKPAEVVSEILAAGNMSMYHLIYGKSDDDEKGLFAYFFKKADGIFDKFDKFFEDKFDFSFKAWFKNLMGKAKETETAQSVKSELKAAGKWMKDETMRMFGFEPKAREDNGEGETEDIGGDNGTAAFGRKVTKTGVVTVSEGEMIIPSDYNPFYHGTNNKKTQLRNEKKAQAKFFGNFARGGFPGATRQVLNLNDREWIYYDEDDNELGRSPASEKDILKYKARQATGNVSEGKAENTTGSIGRMKRNDRVNKMKSGKFNAKDAVLGSASQITNAFEDFIRSIIPDDMEGEKDKINKGIEKIKESQVPKEMQNNAGSMGAGAIIGAGASILSGCIVGPLAGAAIGAGVGLVIRSQKVQNLLFGEDDENGDKKGGLLNKNISNFMVKNIPEMAKFGGVGMVGGLFMGSPVLGAILGSTIGYVKSSDKAKEKLFGKQNEDGTWNEGLIKKDLQDKIKKNAPGIGAGMLAGVIAGPFGIVGNLLVGGAMGYVSTSDQFKDYMFGKIGNDGKRHGGVTDKISDRIFGEKDADGNRKGGIVGGLRDYFFGTGEDKRMGLLGRGKYKDQGLIGAVTGIFDKLGREISIHAKNLLKDASKSLRSKIADAVKSTLGQKLKTSKIVKAAGKIGSAAVGAAKMPFKALKGGLQSIDYKLGRRAIRNGYNLRNEDGSMMTASQRMNARDRFHMSRDHNDGYTNLDRFLTSADTSVEDIEQLQEVLRNMEDPTREFDKNLTDQKGQLATLFDNYDVDPKIARKLEKIVAKGSSDDFDRLTSGLGLNETQMSEVNKLRDAIYRNREDKEKAKADKKQYQRDLLNRTGFLGKIEGLDTRSDSDIRQYLELLGVEVAARQGEDEEKRSEKAKEDEKKLNTKSRNAVITIRDIIQKMYEHMTGEQYEAPNEEDSETGEENTSGARNRRSRRSRRGSGRESESRSDSTEEDQRPGRGRTEDVSASEGESIIEEGEVDDTVPNLARGGRRKKTFTGILQEKLVQIFDKIKGTIKGSSASEGGSDTGLADERDDIVTQTTMFGDVMQYTRSNQGELVPDLSDSETRNSMESMGLFKSSIGKLGALTGISGLLSSIKDGLFGSKDGEKKEGIFSKLFDKLFGEDGFLSGLFHTITGSKFGQKVKNILGSNPLRTVFTNIIGPALLFAGFAGKFDEVASAITNGAFGSKGSKADEKTATAKDANGNDVKVTWDEEKQAWVDADGNVYSDDQVSDVNVRKTQMGSLSDKLKYNTVRGVLTNTKSVASVVLGKTGIGKKVTAGVKAITSSIGDDAVALAARTNLGDTLIDACTKFTSMLRKVPALSKIADKLDDMGLALAEKMTTALGSQSAKKVAEFAKNAVVWAKVAFIVIDFTSGYEDARTTLGIVDEPTVGQKIISGLLRAIKNFIPVVGTLIPDSLVVDVFCQYVAPALGINPDELMAQREKAKETVDNWNATHGADEQVESVGEFNKKVLKDYTWTERVGNAAKSTWEDTKLKASNMVNGIKEKGIGGYLKDTVSNIGSTFMESYKEDGGGLSGIFSGIGATFKSMLPGVLGDIAEAKGNIRSLATKGDIGGLWGVTLSDFGGGGEAVEGTDLTTAVPGIFSKIIGQIPLLTTKVAMTPVALISKLFGTIKDFFSSDMFDSLKQGADNLLGVSDIVANAKKGDLGAVWSYSGADDEDNGFMKVVKTIPSTVTKIAMTVPTVFFAVGNKIKGFIDGIVSKVKAVGSVMNQVQQDTIDMVNDPDSSLFNDFLNFDKYSLDEEGNPIGGLTKAVAVVTRLTTFGGLLVGAIGRKIGDFIRGLIDQVKNNVKGIAQNQLAVANNAKTGSITEMWNTEIKEVEGSPVNGLVKAVGFMNKIAYTPVAAGFWVGNKIKEAFNKIVGFIKTNISGIAQNHTNVNSKAEQGDLSGVWNTEIQDVEGSPINGLIKAAGFMSKIAATPNAIFHMVGNKVKEVINKGVNLVKTNVAGVAQNQINISTLADSGDVGGVWDYEIQEVEGSPVNGLVKAAGFMSKVASTPSAIFHMVGNKVKEIIDNVVDLVKTNVAGIAENSDNIKQLADDGDVGGIWDYEIQEVEGSPINSLVKAAGFVNKISNTPIAVFKLVGNKLKEFIDEKIKAISGDKDNLDKYGDEMKELADDGDVGGVFGYNASWNEEDPIKGVFGLVFGVQKIGYTITAVIKNVLNKITGIFEGIWSGLKKFITGGDSGLKETEESYNDSMKAAEESKKSKSGSGSGIRRRIKRYKGGNSGVFYDATKDKEYDDKGTGLFVSQYADEYAGMPFGKGTVGEYGCAPAAATMLMNFNKPGSMTMKEAINKANPYEEEDGTSADYFGNILKSKGMSSNYIDTTNKTGANKLIDDLANGRPAILLGADSSNNMKKNSPFGPTSHFVMAKGFDDNGNLVINDPESDKPDQIYSSDILKHTRMAVTTDQVAEENTDAMLKLTGGETVPDNEITKEVWGFFTKAGLSPAATAGIMGNLYQESGVNPKSIQGGGKGPAAGMFQWENYNTKSSRWKALYDYAASKGKDWTDLDSQLNYALSEINGNSNCNWNNAWKNSNWSNAGTAPVTREQFKSETDVEKATRQFEAAFERAGKPNMPRRIDAAAQYYNLYSGSTYTGNYSGSIANAEAGASGSYGSSGSTGSSSSGSSGGDYLSQITSIFSNALGTALGQTQTTDSSIGSSSSGGFNGSTGMNADVAAANTPEGKGTAQSFIDIARSQLGFVETPNNITPYGKFTGTDGQAWCAAFVSWCMDKAFNGNKEKGKKAMRGPYSAAVSGLWNNFKSNNAMTRDAQPGDIVIYKNGGSSHTGLVEKVEGDTVTTIEGNTSGGAGYNRNGGMVARKTINRNDTSRVTGFGRPDWDAAAAVGAGSGLAHKKNANIGKFRNFKGGNSTIATNSTDDATKLAETLLKNSKDNAKMNADNSTVVGLLQNLINLVKEIATNTSSITDIGTTLKNYCGDKLSSNVSSTEPKKTPKNSKVDTKSKIDPEKDPALQDLMSTLGLIAQG